MFSVLFFSLITFSLCVYKIITKNINNKRLILISKIIKEYIKTISVDKMEDNEEYLKKIKTINQETEKIIPKLKDKAVIIPK